MSFKLPKLALYTFPLLLIFCQVGDEVDEAETKTGIMKIPSALTLVAIGMAAESAAPSLTIKMMSLATVEVRFELLRVLLHLVMPMEGIVPPIHYRNSHKRYIQRTSLNNC